MRYFYGADTYGAREEISHIVEKAQATIRWVDREDIEAQSIGALLDGASGLFGNDVVVVRDLSGMPKGLQEQILPVVEHPTDWIAWDRVTPDKRSKLFKTLKKYGTEFQALSSAQIVAWLQEHVAIDDVAARELVARVGTDRWRLYNEVQRLALTCDPITIDDIRSHIPAAETQEDMFAMLDALAAGNGRQALSQIEHMLTAGESELYILSMLAYQFKTILAIKLGKTTSLHPFVVQKNQAAARRLPQTFLQSALARILATDFAIKQGTVDARTGLMMLVIGFTEAIKQPS